MIIERFYKKELSKCLLLKILKMSSQKEKWSVVYAIRRPTE